MLKEATYLPDLQALFKHRFNNENTVLHELARSGNQALMQVAVEVVRGTWAVLDRLSGSAQAGSQEEVVARLVNARNNKYQVCDESFFMLAYSQTLQCPQRMHACMHARCSIYRASIVHGCMQQCRQSPWHATCIHAPCLLGELWV